MKLEDLRDMLGSPPALYDDNSSLSSEASSGLSRLPQSPPPKHELDSSVNRSYAMEPIDSKKDVEEGEV